MTIAPHRSTVAATEAADVSVFSHLESEVRLYCRKFPVVFDRAKGAELVTEDGRRFVDFFCGAGSLNYGHNNDAIKRRVVDYLAADRVMHGLDMHTVAKREFLTALFPGYLAAVEQLARNVDTWRAT